MKKVDRISYAEFISYEDILEIMEKDLVHSRDCKSRDSKFSRFSFYKCDCGMLKTAKVIMKLIRKRIR
jgi:hypothetical protein